MSGPSQDDRSLADFRRALLAAVCERVAGRADVGAVGSVVFDPRGSEPPAEAYTLEAALSRVGSLAPLRYFALAARPADPWVFTWTGLDGAAEALEALRRQLAAAPDDSQASSAAGFRERLRHALAAVPDSPRVLALLWELARSDLPAPARRELLESVDAVLELGLVAATVPEDELPAGAAELIQERAVARAARDWSRSDALRQALADLGVETRDTPQGSLYRRTVPSTPLVGA